jgi:chromosome segregation ATPase
MLSVVLDATFPSAGVSLVYGRTDEGGGAAVMGYASRRKRSQAETVQRERAAAAELLPLLADALQAALDEWERDLAVLDEHMSDVRRWAKDAVDHVEGALIRANDAHALLEGLRERLTVLEFRVDEWAEASAHRSERLAALERLHASEQDPLAWWERPAPAWLTVIALVISATAFIF